MNLIYIGSSVPEEKLHKAFEMGSLVNFASNTLQSALLDGFSQHCPEMKVISGWGMSPYPKVPVKRIGREVSSIGSGKDNQVLVGGWNLPVLNLLSRFWRTRKELKRSLRMGEDNYVVVYEVHTPYLLAAMTLRKRIKRSCLIVPDLPEFMSEKGNWLRQTMKNVDKMFINWCVKRFDSFALLSEPMRERMPIEGKPWILMEGIFMPMGIVESVEKVEERVVMYTGNCYRRRGIDVLLDAFSMIDKSNYRLWIRGNGDMVSEIINCSKKDPRIVYFEPVPREEILRMERKATVMVNSTPPSMDFSRYFFPSKTMEYLASGTPTIQFHLGCMPKEYDEHVFYAKEESAEALRDIIVEVCEKPQEELNAFGAKAREFILTKKTPYIQCGRIIEFMKTL